jgi:hypothetical protein
VNKISFFTYFTSAYGTLWLVVVLISLVSQSTIQTGAFGMYGFPVIALVYAIVRAMPTPEEQKEMERLKKENDLLQAQLKALMFYQTGEIR